ncbi:MULTISPECIES: ROK family protein [unclassified Nocardioides]|uniref:ROK family protein n=1 Tax=unclassified Nocardioides TaxID=2615069 RepID=UPI00360DDBF0
MKLGLDIGATKTLGVVLDDDGAIRAEVREPTTPGPDGVVASAGRVVDALRAATGDPLSGPIGVGIPGLVDVERGAVQHAVNLALEGEVVMLGDLLGERLGVRALIENDVNAAALGAAAFFGESDLVYLGIGTGLAAGLVLDGQLRRGVHGAAGEVGHLPVDPHGTICSCGQRGCLETIASGSALAAAWPSGDVPPSQALFAAAQTGDAKAIQVRDDFATGVADAVRALCLTVDPATIVIGGGVAQIGEALRVSVAQALLDQAADSPFLASLDLAGRVRVVPADYPVAAVGAALLGK